MIPRRCVRSVLLENGATATPEATTTPVPTATVEPMTTLWPTKPTMAPKPTGSFDCYHVSNPSILRAPFGCHAMFLMADAMLVAPNSLRMFITTFLRAAMTCGAEAVRT